MNYTSIEQSKKLLELGLSPDTADMYYTILTENSNEHSVFIKRKVCRYNVEDGDIPCWSLGALLNLMPTQLYINNNAWEAYCPVIYLGKQNIIVYKHSDTIAHSEHSKDIIDVAYKMVVWLLENGYIKT